MLQGGVATGLSHVETAKSPKLFIVKGKRQPVIRQLPTISWKEFNDGDVFVLDTMSHIFVWIGKNANRLERLQASKVNISFFGNNVIVYLKTFVKSSRIKMFDNFYLVRNKVERRTLCRNCEC